MRKLISWLSSWATTLQIRFCERETYRFLTSDEPFSLDDFADARRPEPTFRVIVEIGDNYTRQVPGVTQEELDRFTQAWKDAGFGKDKVNQITLTGTDSYTAYGTNIFGIFAKRES